MNNYNVITEAKSNINAKDIKIHLYRLPVRDMNKRLTENGAVAINLSKANGNIETAFLGQLIGSFQPITNWKEYKFISEDYRNIDLTSFEERKLLERLLLKDIVTNADKQKYKAMNNLLYITNPIYDAHDIQIFRYFKFDINIDDIGDVTVGFGISHDFEYKYNLDTDILKKTISKGDKVKDRFHNITYEYIGEAPFTISDKNDYMGQSIKEYYIGNNQEFAVKYLPDSMRAVLVKSKSGIFPYIPSRLKKYCRFENLSTIVLRECKNLIKQNPTDKMFLIIKETLNILEKSKYIKVNQNNMMAEKIGYKVFDLKNPQLVFGNNTINQYPSKGLMNPKGGTFEKKSISIKYFVDPDIINNKTKLDFTNKFCNELEDFSKRIGVELNREKVGNKANFKAINTKNEDSFKYDLKNIISNFDNTTIVILEDENLKKYYTTIKKTFGYQNNIATQCINFKSLNYNEKGKNSLFLNILLGLYAKNGIQPWVLKDRLNSDCFIGLDVSREDKVNKAGIVQVIGYNGKVLRTKVISSSQSGEIIKTDTLKEIVYEAVSSFEKAYGRKPEHITFHRDGLNREKLQELKSTTTNLGIKFDYIEVTKNINRRLATLNINKEAAKNKEWTTVQGRTYIKDNYAYLCTTSSNEYMGGMANPIRIKQVEGVLNIKDVIEDVYKLSFMHIGAINKIRLPITTYYADLSSTYGNRELMPVNIDSNSLHFI